MANSINFYHDCLEDFNTNYVGNSNACLRIAQWNIRGMNDLLKFDNIPLFLDNLKVSIDVLVISETWIKTANSVLYEIPGYNSIFSCRDTSSGGLAVYIREGLGFNVSKNVAVDGFHLIDVEIVRNSLSYEIVGLYRPPSFDINRFFDELEYVLSVQNKRPRFFAGDMNIPINLSSNNVVVRYKNLLESYNYICSNSYVTRPISNNILDHFICRNEDLGNIRNDTIYTDVSDHLQIVSSFVLHQPKTQMDLKIK